MSFQDLPTPVSNVAPEQRRHAAIQVICLGSGGGPSEDNVSGFLVRSSASGWVRGSILAVDAGTHLAAITRILEQHLPAISRDQVRADSDGNLFQRQALSPQNPVGPTSSPPSSPLSRSVPPPKLEPIVLDNGPFAGVPLPHASARANAAHIVRSHVASYLISHPHLDHLSGFAINTAAFHATSRPKTLAALPFTVEAIKKHIFNDVIWPNLTDEDGGVGFVTFQRLKEGGDVMVGEGEGRGYIEVCEGLSTKAFKISHGKCMRPGTTESHRGSLSNLSDIPNGYAGTPKHYNTTTAADRHMSLSHLHLPGTPGSYASPTQPNTSHPFQQPDPNVHAVDSTAYFIRDLASHREILMFGDVEPDSISVAPRLARVWAEAAPKIAAGVLTGIFIECSYADAQGDAVLFGHLAPRHLIAELQVLGEMVREERAVRASEKAMRKRKRMNGLSGAYEGEGYDKKRSRSLVGRNTGVYGGRRSSVPDDYGVSETGSPRSGVTSVPVEMPGQGAGSPGGYVGFKPLPAGVGVQAGVSEAGGGGGYVSPGQGQGQGQGLGGMPAAQQEPLKGLRVLVMHVKDTMKDGPHISEVILQQLNEHAAALAQRGVKLGCQFEISEAGRDYWF
ncbi:cAMP phosphodiesterases class-II-like protein [Elsinoe fawcettii]|nr:cAMP phosphodiesterases class-II-like protein [Elsinoe fawcettii]